MLISCPFVLTCVDIRHATERSAQIPTNLLAAHATGLKASELQQFHLRYCVSGICCLKLCSDCDECYHRQERI